MSALPRVEQPLTVVQEMEKQIAQLALQLLRTAETRAQKAAIVTMLVDGYLRPPAL